MVWNRAMRLSCSQDSYDLMNKIKNRGKFNYKSKIQQQCVLSKCEISVIVIRDTFPFWSDQEEGKGHCVSRKLVGNRHHIQTQDWVESLFIMV